MNDKAVTNWSQELAKYAKDVASLERPSATQISLRSGMMTYRGMMIPNNKLPCIVVAAGVERRYDTKPFDAENITPPDCFALSLTGRDVAPCPESPNPQSTSCDVCPRNAWQPNPARPGKKHKPCKERRRIALIPAESVKSGVKSAEIALLAVPVMSVKNWAAYVNRLAAEFARPPWAMLTEISVVPNTKSQFEVKFEPLGTVSDDALADIQAKIEQAEAVITTPYDATGYMVPEDGKASTAEKKARKF